MEYVLASTGRCGTRLLIGLLESASARKMAYVNSLDEYNGHVKLTHMTFREEPDFDYRAIFLYGDISDCIASLYTTCGNKFYRGHFKNLEMKKEHHNMFFKILNSKLPKGKKLLSFLYLVIGDKFRFKEKITSWKRAKNVLFIKYEDLCNHKKKILNDISNHLGLVVPDFEVVKRRSSRGKLPLVLQLVIKFVY